MSLAEFLDEEELSPHESAWLSKDWDKVEELVKEYGKDKENTLFNIIDEINNGKTPLVIDDVYDKYFVDNAMSQHIDTIYNAYVMNLVGGSISDQMHYNYYLNSVRKAKRFGAWAKLSEDFEEKIIIEILREKYSVNTRTAMEYLQELKTSECSRIGKENTQRSLCLCWVL
ncbi:clamp loader small subunit [Klebsiella phage CPRSB]|nr:clamp loader small subunit [Klebsiella phage CPRSB]